MSEDNIQRYEQMLAEDPESRSFAPLAEAYRKAGRLDDAIRVARAGLEIHPGYSGGLLVLGRALFETRELEPAVEVLLKAVADSPENYLGQKFLGKALKDKGDVPGALRALEAANFLSPEDEEVVQILEEMKKKADPPKEIVFEAGSARGSEEAELVTYEQKPTTVDGIELEPLPTAEAFSFSPEGQDVTLDPAAVRPEKVVETPVAADEAGETVIEVPEDDLDEIEGEIEDVAGVVQVDDLDDIDEFDPEIAAFIQEGESLAEASASEDVIPETVPDVPSPVPPPPPAAEVVTVTETEPVTQDTPPPAAELVTEPVTESVTQTPEPVTLDDIQVKQSAVDPVVPEPTFPEPEPALDLDLEPEAPGPVPEDFSAAPSVPGFELSSPPPLDASATGGPISTETLADLYAQQGLTDKALEIYRQILQERPGDEIVELKISALEGAMEQTSPEPSPHVPAPRQPSPAQPPVPEAPEPVAAPVPEPAPAMEPTPGETPAALESDTTEILGQWLENAERMKKDDL
jgi:tetratricopeptide (TPR) repeat protein